MLLVRDALACGLPVYIACRRCQAPSRAVELSTLAPTLDLDAAAAGGRFRCTACQSRDAMVMPVVGVLLQRRRRLHIRCIGCGREEVLNARQACETYGVATPFDELRRRLRCSADCAISAGAMTDGGVEPGAARAPGRRGGPLRV
jgi:hypothetical protein